MRLIKPKIPPSRQTLENKADDLGTAYDQLKSQEKDLKEQRTSLTTEIKGAASDYGITEGKGKYLFGKFYKVGFTVPEDGFTLMEKEFMEVLTPEQRKLVVRPKVDHVLLADALQKGHISRKLFIRFTKRVAQTPKLEVRKLKRRRVA